MKNILIFLFIVLFGSSLFAQNDIQYSQFFFNKLAFNPAYAGSREALTLGAIYRHQWSGINGAPRTASVYAHLPFLNNRNGAGLSIMNDQIGRVNVTNTDLSYAYHIPMGKNGKLGLGVNARFEYGQIDWSNTEVIDAGDDIVPSSGESYTKPNFGVGLFYSNKNFFLGLSVPQLLRNSLYFEYNEESYNHLRSYYLMGGVMLKMSDVVWFKPTAMISYSPNAPFELDVNASFLFLEKIWIGASYRKDDALSGVLQYVFSPQFKAGIAYDFTTSELQNYTSGSWEFLMEYTFKYENEGKQHLRFF